MPAKVSTVNHLIENVCSKSRRSILRWGFFFSFKCGQSNSCLIDFLGRSALVLSPCFANWINILGQRYKIDEYISVDYFPLLV